jgi:hypothetical protein
MKFRFSASLIEKLMTENCVNAMSWIASSRRTGEYPQHNLASLARANNVRVYRLLNPKSLLSK